MLEQLQANLGENIVLELAGGRKISGVLLAADKQFVRMETDEGVGNIPTQAIHIVWENLSRATNEINMEEVAGLMRDSVKAEIACTAYPGFTCSQSYICRPPDTCTFSFACPGSYVPSTCGPFQFGSQCNTPGGFACAGAQFYGVVGPQGEGPPSMGQMSEEDTKAQIACSAFPGFTCARSYICRPPDTCTFSFACPGSYAPSFPSGGGCPSFSCGPFQFGQPCGPRFQCGPFQFGQPCSFQFGQPCSFQFGQPCGPRFQCGPFQFGQPCGPRFQCGPFQFGQPCGPQFQCRPFQFGSQCTTPGGFACAGQQFIGVAGPAEIVPGQTANTTQNTHLPPMTLAVDEEGQSKENKENKE